MLCDSTKYAQKEARKKMAHTPPPLTEVSLTVGRFSWKRSHFPLRVCSLVGQPHSSGLPCNHAYMGKTTGPIKLLEGEREREGDMLGRG